MSCHFDPPYDSPIEEILAWGLSKHLVEGATLDKQVEVDARFAKFYLDLVVSTPAGYKVGFECDGKEFHVNTFRDKCRDALILGTKSVSAVYRFRGQDLFHHEHDCLYFVARKDPSLFSARGLRNIQVLASDEATRSYGRSLDCWDDDEGGGKIFGYEIDHTHWFFYDYEAGWGHMAVMERRSLDHPKNSMMHHFLAFAAQHKHATFDELVKDYWKEARASAER